MAQSGQKQLSGSRVLADESGPFVSAKQSGSAHRRTGTLSIARRLSSRLQLHCDFDRRREGHHKHHHPPIVRPAQLHPPRSFSSTPAGLERTPHDPPILSQQPLALCNPRLDQRRQVERGSLSWIGHCPRADSSMKMEYSGFTEPSRNSSDVKGSLESIFQHPAGLQTARDLVQAVATQWFAQPTNAPPTRRSETSPEVEGILRDILAFSDSQDRSFYRKPTAEGSGVMEDTGDFLEVEQVIHSSVDGLPISTADPLGPSSRHIGPATTSRSAPRPRIFQFTSLHQRPFSDRTAENEIRSIFSARTMNSSLLLGAESPYRVESPASPTAASSSSQGTLDTHAVSSRSGGFCKARFSTSSTNDHRSQAGSSSSNLIEQSTTALSIGRTYRENADLSTKASSSTSISYAGIPSSQPSTPFSESSTIKSFLPVNKIIVDNRYLSVVRQTHDRPDSSTQQSVEPRPSQQPTQGTFFSSLQSPSPPPSFPTPLLGVSPSLNDLSSPGLTDTESETEDPHIPSTKRKLDVDDAIMQIKRLKRPEDIAEIAEIAKPSSKKGAKRSTKLKEPRPEQARQDVPDTIWMRILEFTPPNFLTKARLINKRFKSIVDRFDSIFVNCRKENFGWDMPPPPLGLTERQYSDLFGGKGCLELGCTDELSSRTHWSWAKRWCQDCWKSKIEREDRAIKKYQNQYGRLTLTKLLECIPVGVHDSFMKPHDYIDNIESRERQAPRLYKYYLIEDVENVIKEYEELTPAPFVDDPNHTPDEKAAARADHQRLMDGLEEKRNEFFAIRKKATDEHMAQVQKIETAVRKKRDDNREPNNANRDARKALFLRRAQEDLPQIPSDFVKTTKAFKAATRIFRNGGTERGWQTLRPKIEKEWEESSKTQRAQSPVPGLESSTDNEDTIMADSHSKPSALPSINRPAPSGLQHRSIPGYASHLYGLTSSSITDLSSSIGYRNNASHVQHLGGMYSSSSSNRTPSHMAYLGGAFLPQPSYLGNASNSVYGHNSSHFQQMMGTSSFNNHQAQHHGSHHAPRPMSIPSLLADPPRIDPMTMRFNNGHSQYMG